MEEKDLINRFDELYERSYTENRAVFTDFLDLQSQDILERQRYYPAPVLYGGYEGAERRAARFGEDGDFPLECIRISPKDMKFAEELTHRDMLGAILSLGIERRTVGDIVMHAGSGYVFVLSSVRDLILDELDRVRHTAVVCSVSSLPEGASSVKEERTAIASSERLDAVVSAVCGMSRADGKSAVDEGRVFIRGSECREPSRTLKAGDVVSVRGHGKFLYAGESGVTGKGRLRVKFALYK